MMPDRYDSMMQPTETQVAHARRAEDQGKSWWQVMDPRERIGLILFGFVLFTNLIVFPAVLVILKTDSNTRIKESNDKIAQLQRTFSQKQDENKEVGYQNRAATCRLLVAANLPLGINCLDPNVTRYYDPTNAHNVVKSLP
jgi:hypothetical protein